MSANNCETKMLEPHHEQQSLCTTRLPYRQGKKLTAVKTYTITNESNHLLIFGVPAINLRQETKNLFTKFGKIIEFNITKEYPNEQFTDTFHARFESIKDARIAKKMLDTKNFYGGVLHVCYAPEKESIAETTSKLIQRQKDVLYRLKNLQKEYVSKNDIKSDINTNYDSQSTINTNYNISNTKNTNYEYSSTNTNDSPNFCTNYNSPNTTSAKYQSTNTTYHSPSTTNTNCQSTNTNYHSPSTTSINYQSANTTYHSPSTTNHNIQPDINTYNNNITQNIDTDGKVSQNGQNKLNMGLNNIIYLNKRKKKINDINVKKLKYNIDVIDCTSVSKEVVTNINLNYNNFGNEVIRKIDTKPLNVIKFNK